ncbi:MAG: D-alanyl-D-alanine carboxypeptidase [Lachnospiraceae bacterium]|nr:D-alanyl-D-alanine carboxypeptidase [Lachnospiraceae bacterium]
MKIKVLLLLLAVLLTWLAPQSAGSGMAADVKHAILEDLLLEVDGHSGHLVKTVHYQYRNNRYLSLRDLALALSGTEKTFGLSVTDNAVTISMGEEYLPAGGEGQPFSAGGEDAAGTYTTRALALNSMTVDGRNVRLHTLIGKNTEDKNDCYMSLTDLVMLFDLDMTLDNDGLHVDTGEHFTQDMGVLRAQGFFYEVHSALVGDATTGEIFAAYEEDLPVPIASTSKLMTYLCVMDAVQAGQIHLEDMVVIPKESERISKTSDGTIAMQAGQEVSLRELLLGLLLPSSNECAVALAEHVSGSEAAFTERMNARAVQLGMSADAVFYNSSGLPVFTDTIAATKVQNRMTAKDMFLLAGHILRTYPEIMEITSMQSAELPGFQTVVKNTNPTLYNLNGVVGLKTGTTAMAGASLVSALKAEAADGSTHLLVAVEFGAEDSVTRATLSEELLLYGRQYLTEHGGGEPVREEPPGMPQNAEELIRRVILNNY